MLNIFNKNKHMDNAEFKKDLNVLSLKKKSNDLEWERNLQIISDENYWNNRVRFEADFSSNVIPFVLDRN
jgi:hypothetical protein